MPSSLDTYIRNGHRPLAAFSELAVWENRMSWEEGYQQGQARAAIGENAGLRSTVGSYAGALNRANANIDRAQGIINDLGAQVNRLNEVVAMHTQEVNDFRLKLIVETAHAAGLTAYRDAFKKAHPNSPVLADSGRRFEDGDIKTHGRTLYEEDFDRVITNHKLERPTDYRTD